MSPSTFAKPRLPALKSGSHAQQAPDGVSVGFASAGSLWNLNELEDEKQQSLGQASKVAAEVTKASMGKLVKPKKAGQNRNEELSKTDQGSEEYAYLEPDEPKRKKAKTIAVTKPTQKKAKVSMPAPAPNHKPAISLAGSTMESEDGSRVFDKAVEKPKPRKPRKAAAKADDMSVQKEAKKSIPASPSSHKPTFSLAEYALESECGPKFIDQVVEKPKAKPKKPRKKAAKADDATVEVPVKKPRKRKMKSESIILNSDEPEPNHETTTASDYFVRPQTDRDTAQRNEKDSNRNPATIEQLQPVLDESPPSRCTESEAHDRFQELETGKDEAPTNAIEQSAYFLKSRSKPAQREHPLAAEPPEGVTKPLHEPEEAVSPVLTRPVPSRRRDWTPVKQSAGQEPAHQRPPTADSEASETSCEPRRQLSDVLGSFGYVSADAGALASERNVTGEAATKKRKVELGAPVGIITVSRIEAKGQAAAVPKPAKQKKERKKAQTITALATAAFQPPKEDKPDEGAVSHFFSPQQDDASNQTAPVEQPKPKVIKPRKPRKPKDQTKSAGKQETSTKAKKPPRKNSVKVKFNEADYRSKLYSPDRATAQLKGQDVLFGTSSQLAVDERAEFIRDTLASLQQSELQLGPKMDGGPMSSQAPFSQAQQSPQGKSCVKVPTAPHGTCLSIEQARRELWCVPSRDLEGAIFKSEGIAAAGPREVTAPKPEFDVAQLADEGLPIESDDLARHHSRPESERVEIDLCDTSPIEARQNLPHEAFANVEDTMAYEQRDGYQEPSPCLGQVTVQADDEDDDDWMFHKASSPPPAAQPSIGVDDLALPHINPLPGFLKILSPRRFRPPLSPLHPNIMMFTDMPPSNQFASSQIRALSSTAKDQARKSRSPTGRGPGRPRKEAAVESFSPSPPKRRGRPPKAKTLASDPSPQNPDAKKRKTAHSASQPIEQPEWIDIDDIYDSDSPTTPSPPRRRARSSPPAVQPLTLSPSGSPSLKAKAPGIVALSCTASLKAVDTHWATIRSDLFSRITAVVKSAPRSTDAGNPSWWDKILLYDPIVLEDLTAWLNQQGLRVEVKRLKPKPKKRGRKNKDAKVEEEEVEWEVQQEPVQAWMVQKWCEEKSICCLWKEGLRGGVRTKY